MIRRFYSILFLALILFNTIGYYCLFLLDKQKTEKIVRLIEGNANEISGNLILRIPKGLPYSNETFDYRPIDGEISYDGEIYRLVKQKYYNDTLFVVCVRDAESQELRKVIHDYAESFTDHPISSNSGLKIFSLLSKDYIAISHAIQSSKSGWSRILNFADFHSSYSFAYETSIFQPPQQG